MTAPADIDLAPTPALAVAWRAAPEIEVARIETSPDIADLFRDVARQHLDSLGNRRRRQYAPDVDIERKEEYATAPRAGMSDSDPILSLLDRTTTMDPSPAAELPARTLLLYAFVFPGQAMFVRKSNPHLSARGGHVFTRLTQTLVRIEEPIFDFDQHVDLVVTDDELLISNTTAFEYLFKDDAFLTRNVPQWVASIAAALPLAPGSDQALIERGLSNVRRRRRMEAIADRGHLEKVTPEALAGEIERLGLGADRLLSGGGLVVSDDTIEDVLKLLNEDLFIGGLSGSEFEVDRKALR